MTDFTIWSVIPPLEGTYLVEGCSFSVWLDAYAWSTDEHRMSKQANQFCRVHLDEEKVEVTTEDGCTQMRNIDVLVAAAVLTLGEEISLNTEPIELPSARIGVVNRRQLINNHVLQIMVLKGRVVNSLVEKLKAATNEDTRIRVRLDTLEIVFLDGKDGNKEKSVISVKYVGPRYADLTGRCLRLSTEKLAEMMRKGVSIHVSDNATQEDIEDAAFILDYLSMHIVK